MINPVSASEQLMYSTLRIQTSKEIGSGFYTDTPNGTKIAISNRHLVEGTDKLDFTKTILVDKVTTTVHLDDGSNVEISGDVHWFLHPSEDLAFFIIDELLNQNLGKISPHQVYLISIPLTYVPTTATLSALNAVEDITMIGYPNGFYDEKNNYPLFRFGKTASHPAVDFNGEHRGMIDVPCIPGSSGSPVFILNESMYYDKKGTTNIGSRVILLGVEVAMPRRINADIHKVSKDASGNTILSPTDYVLLEDFSMGFYIKSSELNAFNPVFSSLGI